jgi:hypothetical protein
MTRKEFIGKWAITIDEIKEMLKLNKEENK